MPEDKALALDVLWAEVPVEVEALLAQTGEPVLRVLNTNAFFLAPCPKCGNDAPTNAQAFLRVEARREAERQRQAQERQRREQQLREQQDRARQLHLAEQRAAREQRRQAQATERAQQEARLAQARTAASAQQQQDQRFLQTFLQQHAPDATRGLMAYTCVLTPCPGCQTRTVFFDPTGTNMVPTHTQLVARQTPYHPWHCVCVHCGWQGARPPEGTRLIFRPAQTPARPSQTEPAAAFWWQDGD